MNWFVATKEEYEKCNKSVNGLRGFQIDTPSGIRETVYLDHAELATDWGLQMVRVNPYNLITHDELQYILPKEVE